MDEKSFNKAIYELYVLLDHAADSINYIPNGIAKTCEFHHFCGKRMYDVCVSGSVRLKNTLNSPLLFDGHQLKSRN